MNDCSAPDPTENPPPLVTFAPRATYLCTLLTVYLRSDGSLLPKDVITKVDGMRATAEHAGPTLDAAFTAATKDFHALTETPRFESANHRGLVEQLTDSLRVPGSSITGAARRATFANPQARPRDILTAATQVGGKPASLNVVISSARSYVNAVKALPALPRILLDFMPPPMDSDTTGHVRRTLDKLRQDPDWAALDGRRLATGFCHHFAGYGRAIMLEVLTLGIGITTPVIQDLFYNEMFWRDARGIDREWVGVSPGYTDQAIMNATQAGYLSTGNANRMMSTSYTPIAPVGKAAPDRPVIVEPSPAVVPMPAISKPDSSKPLSHAAIEATLVAHRKARAETIAKGLPASSTPLIVLTAEEVSAAAERGETPPMGD